MKILFELDSLLSIFIDLSLEFSLSSNDLSFKSLSDLSFFLSHSFKFIVSILNDILKFVDLSVEQFKLIVMGILEEGQFRFFNSFKFISKVAKFDISNSFCFEDFIFQIFVFFL